ncbi:MAG: FMN-binding glutamate synthase family protein [Spongiibacteraceae bacterium]
MTIVQAAFWLIAIIANVIAVLLWSQGWSSLLLLFTLAFTALGIYDLKFSPHTLNRLYPIAAYLRYALEFIRIEIQQYFIASNTEERPFNREQRSLVYQRAKKTMDTLPFGTQRDLMETGYLTIMHSLAPKIVAPEHFRVTVGGPQCRQPYSASRLNISAMSFGALGSNAITALNLGAKLGNFAHNTGEGGISPYHQQGGDLIWQIGTGYFGCCTPDGEFDPELFSTRAQSEQVKMIEIKLSQGAKPAHGGVLPAAKISAEIAAIRGIRRDKDCVSPPTHTTFDNPIGLLKFVQQLRELSAGKPVGIKLCIGVKSEFMAICKAMLETDITPDFITVDGAEGGTGAAPVEFSNRLGMPCHEATHFVHNCLLGAGLRDQIKVIASGKTASGFEMLSKLALGADMVNAARTMMMALGCIQSLTCNSNNCPTGITTQNPVRNKALDVETKHKRVKNYHHATVDSCMELIGAMGLEQPEQLTPNRIMYRDENETNKHYDELYASLQPKELLSNAINPFYAEHWRRALSTTFNPLNKI